MLIPAREAARRLGVKPATLYAYVSRGLLRSVPGPDGREHRYHADDVTRLKRRRDRGARSGAPAQPFDDLTPVLDTNLTLIDAGRVFYRGRDATELAERSTLEDVAGLLWAESAGAPFALGGLEAQLRRLLAAPRLPLLAMDRVRTILVGLSMHDVAALDTSAPAVQRTGSRMVAALASAVSGALAQSIAVHCQLARAWSLDDEAADLLRRCLVLAADHELNASTFVARCIASTGASPYAVVLGALGALSGPRHGGETNEVDALLRDVLRSGGVTGSVAERLQRGERVPGFGHPLYPHGDPRARHIIEAVKRSRYGRRSTPALRAGAAISELIGRHPTIDFALGLVSRILKLPANSGLAIFLVGRSVGWIAHALEQYTSGTLIRPRARYVGTAPQALMRP